MKITKTPDMVRGSIGSGNASSIGGVTIGPPAPPSGPGQGIVSSSSNTASWQPVVSTITSNGSNTLLGPNVNLASGSNIIFSVSSNTLFIHTIVSVPTLPGGVTLTGVPSPGATIIGTSSTTAQWATGSNVTVYWPMLSLSNQIA